MATYTSNLVSGVGDPNAYPSSGVLAGKVRAAMTNILPGSVLANNDLIKIARLPSTARILSIKLWNDDFDTDGSPTAAFNLGLYPVDASSDADALDEDCFVTAATTLQAAAANTELLFEGGSSHALADVQQELWEVAGKSSDDNKQLELVMTMSAAAAANSGSATSSMTFVVLYTVE